MVSWPEYPQQPQALQALRTGARAQGRLTLARIEQLSDLLSAGNTISDAANFSGISERTFHSWRAKGEEEIDRYESCGVDMADALGDDLSIKALWWRPACAAENWAFVVFTTVMLRSRSAGRIRAVHAIQTAAAQGSVHAATWFLEHSDPQHWGSTLRTKITLEAETTTGRALGSIDGTVDALKRLEQNERKTFPHLWKDR